MRARGSKLLTPSALARREARGLHRQASGNPDNKHDTTNHNDPEDALGLESSAEERTRQCVLHKLANRDADKEAGAERDHGEQAKTTSDAHHTSEHCAESGTSPGPQHSEPSHQPQLKREREQYRCVSEGNPAKQQLPG